MKKLSVILSLFSFMAGSVFGQPAAAPLTFEVVSVKPSPPDNPGMFIRPVPGGSLRMTGATLKNLISFAYGVRNFQISGGAQWIGTECFDIEARAETADAAVPTDPAKLREEQARSCNGSGVYWPTASS